MEHTSLPYRSYIKQETAFAVVDRLEKANCLAIACPHMVRRHGHYTHGNWRVYYAPSDLPGWLFELNSPAPVLANIVSFLADFDRDMNIRRVRSELGVDEHIFARDVALGLSLGVLVHPGDSQTRLQLSAMARVWLV